MVHNHPVQMLREWEETGKLAIENIQVCTQDKREKKKERRSKVKEPGSNNEIMSQTLKVKQLYNLDSTIS